MALQILIGTIAARRRAPRQARARVGYVDSFESLSQ
jgi:hypothetical protein